MEDARQDDGFSAKDRMLWNRKPELQPCGMKLLDDLEACYSFLIKIVVLGSKLPVIHLGVNVASVILIVSFSKSHFLKSEKDIQREVNKRLSLRWQIKHHSLRYQLYQLGHIF